MGACNYFLCPFLNSKGVVVLICRCNLPLSHLASDPNRIVIATVHLCGRMSWHGKASSAWHFLWWSLLCVSAPFTVPGDWDHRKFPWPTAFSMVRGVRLAGLKRCVQPHVGMHTFLRRSWNCCFSYNILWLYCMSRMAHCSCLCALMF